MSSIYLISSITWTIPVWFENVPRSFLCWFLIFLFFFLDWWHTRSCTQDSFLCIRETFLWVRDMFLMWKSACEGLRSFTFTETPKHIYFLAQITYWIPYYQGGLILLHYIRQCFFIITVYNSLSEGLQMD